MANLLFYTDPHIGIQRKANSTATSSAAREQYVRELLLEKLADDNHTKAFCLGDFFDKASNSEKTILSGAAIAETTDIILAGNHDLLNNTGACSSLEVILELFPDKVVMWDSRCEQVGNSLICFVPHQLTQEKFDDELREMSATAEVFGGWRILCLHCNYDLNLEVSEETLILSRDRAIELLSVFHYILIGHEHVPTEHFDGRLKILGSVYPSTIGEAVGTRGVHFFDTENGQWSFLPTFDAETEAWVGKAADCPSSGKTKFFTLQADSVEERAEANKLAISLFKEGAYAVKVDSAEQSEMVFGPLDEKKVLSLPELIREDLKTSNPGLLPVWEELSA